jgi:argininosuccinate lyase
MQMSDAFTTGSSIMPQKKNPDMAELVRGKTGLVVGALVSLIITLKGLPLAYNRDLQEDKKPVFDAFDTLHDSLKVLCGALASARFFSENMQAALKEGFLDATEVADWLAAKGVPFRDAHHVAGKLVSKASQKNSTLSDLNLEELREEHPAFDESVYEVLDMERAVERRNVLGGPALVQLEKSLATLKDELTQRGIDIEKVASQYKTLRS